MKEDDSIKKWVESRPDTSCIDLRASLQGGRTGPSRLSAKSVVGKEIIKYFDICSLYPFICSFFDLPIHHPRIVAGSQPYRTPEDVPFGLIKCKVLAPNQKIPTLGVKRHSMLIFANCNKCIELYGKPDKKKPKKNVGRISCTCTDEEREMVVTVTSEELKFAMMTGTVVKEVYHSLEYDKTSNKIFLPFIQSFLKIKTESSHPPADFNTYEGKRRFVDTYKSLYGITIDPENCAFNPGKRFISKIFLNSIWGRFSFQANQAEKDIITPQEFVALTKDETVFDLAAFEFEDNVLMANYKRDVNFIVAAAFYASN
uniref:DNA-directed DNA polymerase n=1 Tax=Panagrolaimus superbus TaxID=310955 RepID=A0A914Z3G8_9BILA